MTKIAVVLEQIYYGILAKSGLYARALDHGPGNSPPNSKSFYDAEGRWRVQVYTKNGEPSFSYLAHYLEDLTQAAPTVQFRCEVFVKSADTYDSFHSDFDSFHGLILFLIDLVSSGKVYRSIEAND